MKKKIKLKRIKKMLLCKLKVDAFSLFYFDFVVAKFEHFSFQNRKNSEREEKEVIKLIYWSKIVQNGPKAFMFISPNPKLLS